MSTVLFITANPNSAEASFSKAVGEAFVAAYREANPQDEVVTVDLFETTVPVIDADVMAAWGQLRAGTPFEALSAVQQEKVSAMGRNLELFKSADKYVFATPFWNFSYPPVVKAFIDNVAMAGETFKYTENGPVGLLTGKKAVHIQASGGVYSEGPAMGLDFGHNHLKAVLAFMGITDVTYIPVEGMAAFPEKAQEIKENAIAAAREVAASF